MSATMKESGLCLLWIMIILLIGSGFWYLSAPFREKKLVSAINSFLAQNGEKRSLDHVVKSVPEGTYFSLKGINGKAILYRIQNNGNYAMILAFLTPDGQIDGIIPVSVHSKRILTQTPQEIQKFYETILLNQQRNIQ